MNFCVLSEKTSNSKFLPSNVPLCLTHAHTHIHSEEHFDLIATQGISKWKFHQKSLALYYFVFYFLFFTDDLFFICISSLVRPSALWFFCFIVWNNYFVSLCFALMLFCCCLFLCIFWLLVAFLHLVLPCLFVACENIYCSRCIWWEVRAITGGYARRMNTLALYSHLLPQQKFSILLQLSLRQSVMFISVMLPMLPFRRRFAGYKNHVFFLFSSFCSSMFIDVFSDCAYSSGLLFVYFW